MITRMYEDGEVRPYLHRRFLLRFTYLEMDLHQFWGSDPDDAHCHPRNNIKIRLKGDYREYNVDGTSEVRKPGSITYRRAQDFHRLEITKGDEGKGWSLFIRFGKKRKWGFLRGDDWIEAGEYGKLVNNPVEINGVDYVIEGTFFPKFKWLTPRGLENNFKSRVTRDVGSDWDMTRKEMAQAFLDAIKASEEEEK